MKRIITWMIYFSDTYTFIYINYSQIMLGLKNSSRLFVRSFVRLFVLILYILWRFTLFSMLLLSFLPYKSSVCNVRFSFLARSWAHTHTHTRTRHSHTFLFDSAIEICIVRLCHASIVAAVAAKCCLLACTFNFNWNNYTDSREL